MTPVDTGAIVNVAIGALPGIFDLIRSRHAATNPGAPPLTDAQVAEGLQQAVTSSLVKNAAWLAAHPE